MRAWKSCTLVSVVMLLLVVTTAARAEITFNGFASIAAGKVTSGTGYLVDYPAVGQYDDDISYTPDSIFALQVSADLTEGLAFTGQLVSRGADEFDTVLEWAYLSYSLTDDLTVQAGRKRLPLFYYSDFFDVGYAYHWIRPPGDTYTLDIINYNGANLLYRSDWGDWSVTANLYTGREDDDDNELLTLLFNGESGPTVRNSFKNILGTSIDASYDWLSLRVTYLTAEQDRSLDDGLTLNRDEVDFQFYGVATVIDIANILFITEWTTFDTDDNPDVNNFNAWYASLGYRIGSFMPHVTFSKFDNDGAEELHDTLTVGVRYDFHPSAAFKIEWSDFDDYGLFPVTGDAKALTLAVDLIF